LPDGGPLWDARPIGRVANPTQPGIFTTDAPLVEFMIA
jgi:hypothetical protein